VNRLWGESLGTHGVLGTRVPGASLRNSVKRWFGNSRKDIFQTIPMTLVPAMSTNFVRDTISRSIGTGEGGAVKTEEWPEMVKAVTLVMLQPPAPAREPTTWTHAPSRPLMQSLLSQFQTPTAPRRARRFFRVWSFFRLPC
jgi:hypothetical protein